MEMYDWEKLSLSPHADGRRDGIANGDSYKIHVLSQCAQFGAHTP